MKPRRSTNDNAKCNARQAQRIVIVDDHPLFRKGLEQLINSSKDGFAVCGEASNAAEAMAVIRKIKPDLAIVDLSLPGANGIELIKNIRAEFPKLPVLVVSMHDESLYATRALKAGAQGYVMKQEALENVIVAIQQVLSGRPYLSPDMSAKLITNFANGSSQADVTDKLSDRELEILELIGKGRDVGDIAQSLHISAKTVETHRAHIKEKLNLKNAREVARFAVQWVTEHTG
jgi:DNA-binding NarL/FixJ family response regulator